MSKRFFITGIGTEIGKTFIAAAFVKALNAAYWKPIQTGSSLQRDSEFIADIVGEGTIVFPERFCLKEPLSPHAAAAREGVAIDIEDFHIPNRDTALIVEGAGGVYVPLNSSVLMIDLIKRLELPVILVSKNYLGSINHTLLSIAALYRHEIPIHGIVFNGEPNQETEEVILKQTKVRCLAKIPQFERIDKQTLALATELISKGIDE